MTTKTMENAAQNEIEIPALAILTAPSKLY